VAGPEHEVGRDPSLREDALVVVDVVEEEVERGHALPQPALDVPPLLVRDDAGHEVEGEHALDPLILGVDRERDALVEERGVRSAPSLVEGLGGHLAEHLVEGAVVRPHLVLGGEHLVEEAVEMVGAVEDGACGHARLGASGVPSPAAGRAERISLASGTCPSRAASSRPTIPSGALPDATTTSLRAPSSRAVELGRTPREEPYRCL
jgi:hypothetical protein